MQTVCSARAARFGAFPSCRSELAREGFGAAVHEAACVGAGLRAMLLIRARGLPGRVGNAALSSARATGRGRASASVGASLLAMFLILARGLLGRVGSVALSSARATGRGGRASASVGAGLLAILLILARGLLGRVGNAALSSARATGRGRASASVGASLLAMLLILARGLLGRVGSVALSLARATGCALHGALLFSVAKKVSKNACPSIRVRPLRDLTSLAARGVWHCLLVRGKSTKSSFFNSGLSGDSDLFPFRRPSIGLAQGDARHGRRARNDGTGTSHRDDPRSGAGARGVRSLGDLTRMLGCAFFCLLFFAQTKKSKAPCKAQPVARPEESAALSLPSREPEASRASSLLQDPCTAQPANAQSIAGKPAPTEADARPRPVARPEESAALSLPSREPQASRASSLLQDPCTAQPANAQSIAGKPAPTGAASGLAEPRASRAAAHLQTPRQPVARPFPQPQGAGHPAHPSERAPC